MKKLCQFGFWLLLFMAQSLSAQWNINQGEVLKYKLHYGFFTAGYATLTVDSKMHNNEQHLHLKGVGGSTGFVSTFFKVNDVYESYLKTDSLLPSYFIRNISEGGYKNHLESQFNHGNQTIYQENKLKNTNKTLKSVKGIQDMLSAFYYLRNTDHSQLRIGSVLKLNILIDDEIYPFQLKVVGQETVDTKFGEIECLKIIPSVMSGRVFKDSESLSMFVTADKNHIPVEFKASLMVGSLKASLIEHKNVKYPLDFKD
jgi:Protein of unknown function (DUF3108)